VGTQTPVAVFKPPKLQVPINKPRFAKGQPFEFRSGNRLIHELGSFAEGSKNPMTQTRTPKFVDEVVAKEMQTYKVIELFQTMTIVSLNMGNFNLEVNNLKNILATKIRNIQNCRWNWTRRGTSRGNINIT